VASAGPTFDGIYFSMNIKGARQIKTSGRRFQAAGVGDKLQLKIRSKSLRKSGRPIIPLQILKSF
jgi:hypothetical protein